jgi:hypothetical protein
LRRLRVGRRPEDGLVLWHRRRFQPHQGVLVELLELLDQILQHLPLKAIPRQGKPVFEGTVEDGQ